MKTPLDLGFKFILLATGFLLSTGCAKNSTSTPASTTPKYLYVTAGACYSGGNTTFSAATASNVTYKINLLTGSRDLVLADYNAFPASPGDSPVGLAKYDATYMAALVEATTGRRLELINRTGNSSVSRSPYLTSTTILSSALRGILRLADGGFLINKTTAFERVTAAGARVLTPFGTTNMNLPCGTLSSVTSLQALSNGKVLFAHAAASNNRIGLISAGGYLTSADCLAGQSAPNANSFPTAMVYLPAVAQLIVAYAGSSTSTDQNSIYVYDINETTNAISGATKIYDSNSFGSTYSYLLYGISSMAFDSTDNSLYVSTAISSATTVTNYAIEKFTYSTSGKSLTRVPTNTIYPFYNYGFDTRCISSMLVED